MDIFEALKQAYKNSQDCILLLDRNMKMIWCSREKAVRFNRTRIEGLDKDAVVTETLTGTYISADSEKKAVKIEPVSDNDGQILGYIATLFDLNDVMSLAENNEFRKVRMNVQYEVLKELSLAAAKAESVDLSKKETHRALREYIKQRIRAGYNASINYEELTFYTLGKKHTAIINVSEVLHSIFEQAESVLLQNGCSLELECDEDIWIVSNKRQFLSAVLNLIVNGCMYNSKDSKVVKVNAYIDKQKRVVINVKDNGDGIDKALFKKAIVPFGLHRSDSDRESLGLAVVKAYCDSVGGQLVHRSSAGKGTSISIVMDLAKTSDYTLRREHRDPVLNKFDYIHILLSKTGDFE